MTMPPMHMIGAVTRTVPADLNQVLDLPDVVGAAGQQRRRAEPGGLALGERGDVFEHGPAQVAPEAHPGPGAEVDAPRPNTIPAAR